MKKTRTIKPLTEEDVPAWQPPPITVNITGSEDRVKKSYRQAHSVLAKIPGGFQKFVMATPEGGFLPCVMLMPTEFRPDIIRHLVHNGCHVMVGQATGLEAEAMAPLQPNRFR